MFPLKNLAHKRLRSQPHLSAANELTLRWTMVSYEVQTYWKYHDFVTIDKNNFTISVPAQISTGPKFWSEAAV